MSIEPDLNHSSWVCLYTQPVREMLAQSSLREGGFETFLPVYRKIILHGRKRSDVLRPLFPRYVFARPMAISCNLASAYRLIGVSSFAGSTLAQSFVGDEVIDILSRRRDADGIVQMDFGHLRPGQKVQITDGPFAGFEAAFAETNDQKRSWIFISLLGKANRVLVGNEQIEVAA